MSKTATLYRMTLPDHMCPSGIKAKALLEEQGYAVDDRPFTTRADVDAFKAEQGVATTPQIFIDGARIGGLSDLKAHLNVSDDTKTYRPVIALFAVAACMAIAIAWGSGALRWVETFIATSMVLLGLQKLQDIRAFATMFQNYDLLAQRWPAYGHIYPFIETGAGLLMLAGVLTYLSAPLALVAATIGAISVYKAVYVDKRDLNCACVGGDSKVPLGFISLTENLMMIGMAVWMLIKINL